jgi:hypothetical protein
MMVESDVPGEGETPPSAADVPVEDVPADVPADAPAGPVGDFGLGTRVYGYIGTLAHVVTDGRTTACGKQIDVTSPVHRLARTPGGMVCGACLGQLVGA